MKELLSNLPNYPPDTSSSQTTKQKPEDSDKHAVGQHHQSHNISAPAKVVYRNDDFSSRETRMSGIDGNVHGNIHGGSSSTSGGSTSNSRRTRPVTAYDILPNNNSLYGMVKQEENEPR